MVAWRFFSETCSDSVARLLKSFHDLCLVRPPEGYARQAPADRHCFQLVYRLFRILPAGSGQPDRERLFTLPQLKVIQEILTPVALKLF